MSKTYPYEETLFDRYLNTRKTIKAMDSHEFKFKKDQVKKQWETKKKLKRQRESINNMMDRAEHKNREVEKTINIYNNLLINSLSINTELNWNDYLKTEEYPVFTYNYPMPQLEDINKALNVPKESFTEFIFPWLINRREKLEKLAIEKLEMSRFCGHKVKRIL